MKTERLFVSCELGDAESYRLAFEQAFGHLFSALASRPAYLDSRSADAYSEDLHRLGLIDAATCIVVLVSRNAHSSRRIDWEIASGLQRDESGVAAALLGIMLPEVPRRMAPQGAAPGVPFFDYKEMPPRLADNVRSGYARIYDWTWICADEVRVGEALAAAAVARRERTHLLDNSRQRLTKDLPAVIAYTAQRERRRRI